MPSPTDFPARGKIIEVRGPILVFQPAGTNYQLHLEYPADLQPQAGGPPIECFIRVMARKVYTVPSGGNFIAPIFGPPKIIQGRVRYADQRTIVVQASIPIICELPSAESAIDLSEGRIQVGHMANVVALSGASMQLAMSPANVA